MLVRKKIFHIARWYPDRNDDLGGVFVKNHVEAISQKNDCIVLYCSVDPKLKTKTTDIDFEVHNGVPTYRAYYKKKITGFSPLDKLLKLRLYFKLMSQIYKRACNEYGNPDINHVHVLLRTGIFANRILKKFGVPYIISEHWSIYLESKKEFFTGTRRLFTKKVIKNASAVTAVSKKLLNAIQNLGVENKYTVVPNTINETSFENKYYKPGKKKKLIHVSEFNDRDKNVSGLLEVINQISQLRSDFEFHLVGYGAAERKLKNYIEANEHLQKVVVFHGKVTGQALARLYGESDVFILFSNTETFACVIIESLCSGTPVISTDVGIAKEVIHAENGMIINPGDQQSLEAAIIKLLDEEISFDRDLVTQSFERKYGHKNISEVFDSIYSEVLSK